MGTVAMADATWEARANMLFHRLDRDSDGLLNKQELGIVFGGKAAVMLRKLVSDESDMVDTDKWISFIKDVEVARGPSALAAFLSFLETEADKIDATAVEATASSLVMEQDVEANEQSG